MNKKVYFAGSIRGGRADAQLYHELIAYINKTDTVLTEFVGNMQYSITPGSLSHEEEIYQKDVGMLKECDVIIAECTTPSLGVGYELAYAEARKKEAHILYRPEVTSLSAMLSGNPYFHVHAYHTKEEAFTIIHDILEEL